MVSRSHTYMHTWYVFADVLQVWTNRILKRKTVFLKLKDQFYFQVLICVIYQFTEIISGQQEGERSEKSEERGAMLPPGILSLGLHVNSWAKSQARTFTKNWKSLLVKNYNLRKRWHGSLSLQTDLKCSNLGLREASKSGMGRVEERPQGQAEIFC